MSSPHTPQWATRSSNVATLNSQPLENEVHKSKCNSHMLQFFQQLTTRIGQLRARL